MQFKQTQIIAALFMCFANFCSAQTIDEQTNTNTATQSWESNVVKKTSLDIGDVKIGTDVEPVVKLTNTTSEPFVIESVSSSCGCMKPVMETRTIDPGKSAELKIRLDTERFRGRRSASIHVLFSQPAGREIKLSAKINIRNLNCEPELIEFLGGSQKNMPATQELAICRVGSPFWKVKSIESSCDRLSATIESFEIDRNEVHYRIKCELKPGSNQQEIQNEKLTLTTNDSSQLTYEIPVVIRNTRTIKVSPAVLDFSNVEIGEKKVAIVRFHSAAEPSIAFESQGDFEVLNTVKINERTYKLEVSQSSPTAKDTNLIIASSAGTGDEKVKLVAAKKK